MKSCEFNWDVQAQPSIKEVQAKRVSYQLACAWYLQVPRNNCSTFFRTAHGIIILEKEAGGGGRKYDSKVPPWSFSMLITPIYSWTPLCRTRLSRTPRYLEQNKISLGFAPRFFSHLLGAISNSVISDTPLSRTVSRSPWLKSTPATSNFITFRRNTGQHQSGSAVKAPPDKMHWKLRNVLVCSWY